MKAVVIILGVIIIALLAVIVFVPVGNQNIAPAPTSTPANGNISGNVTSTDPGPGATLYEYASRKGKTVRAYLAPNQKITNPITFTGNVPAGWAFEASFPVTVQNASGVEIGKGIAAVPNWMSTTTAWYSVTLSYTQPGTATGWIILWNDNPSGLAENADDARIPVTF